LLSHRAAVPLLAIAALTGPASAQDAVSRAQGAIMDGQYAAAASLLRPEATRGDARAQFILGNLYLRGNGVPRDERTAADWYERAARQGHVDAQFELGNLHYQGQGMAKNPAEALKWFLRAATSGGSLAPTPQFMLAQMLEKGEGVALDRVSAHMWYTVAAINAVSPQSQKDYTAAAARLEAILSPEQYQRARRRARECMTSNYTRCQE
jgi:uncharacterized protein